MIRPRLLLLALSIALIGAGAPAEAATYTDLDQFRADAGGRLVDWEDHAAGPVAVDDYKPRGMVLAAPGQTDGHVFSPSSGTVTTVSFVEPDSGAAALTRGFGVEFSDPASGKLELLDAKGQVIQSVVPQTGFVGILLDDGRVAKARITGKPLDDFAYAEPVQDLDGDGVAANDPDADGDG